MRNVSYNNQTNGFEIGNWGNPGVSPRPIKDITFVNNTSYGNGNNSWGGGVINENPDVKNLVIRNNIFSKNILFQIADEAGLSAANLTVEHNLVNDYTGEYQYEIRGTDYVEGKPKFVNPSEANFHLQENSPAIDRGTSLNAPTKDFDENKRPYGADYDLGAYEFIPLCPDCSGGAVVLTNATFPPGKTCECVGTISITIGTAVSIPKDATVTFFAPTINVQAGFHAVTGAVVNMRQQ